MNPETFERDALAWLRADRSLGAGELARRCLGLLSDFALRHPAGDAEALGSALESLAGRMAATRPSMAPVQNLLLRWRRLVTEPGMRDPQRLRETAVRGARELTRASREATSGAARSAASTVPSGATVITHSLSSTVLTLFRLRAGEGVRAIVTESRPLLEGTSLARELSKLHVPTRYITDAQMGVFAPEADLAVVGADSVLADGTVVNKAGTRLLALAARDSGIPFYVCCESLKYARTAPGEAVLESMPPDELDAPPLDGVVVSNVYFDLTPPHLVSAWIDENGVHAQRPREAGPTERLARDGGRPGTD